MIYGNFLLNPRSSVPPVPSSIADDEDDGGEAPDDEDDINAGPKILLNVSSLIFDNKTARVVIRVVRKVLSVKLGIC